MGDRVVKLDCPWVQLKEPRTKPQMAPSPGAISTVRIVTFNALSLGDEFETKSAGQGLRGSGHFAFLSKMMHELQADVCAIQESRLRLPEDFEAKDLECVHSPAMKGSGGILILVRKHARIKILDYKRVCHRILVAHIQIDGRRFKVIACHAPVRDAPEAHHRDFQSQLAPLLAKVPPQDFLVVCADMNARLGNLSQEYSVVGPWTSPIKGSSHVLDLLDVCQRTGVHFLNTLFPPVADDASLPNIEDMMAVNKAVATWKK
eukprot:5198536-Amphidinium_carterae.1